jgi:transcriptional regulator with XRE-family HTH domain
MRKLRKTLRLTQRGFADNLGTTRDIIANMEYGRSEPKEVFLLLICKIYNVNYEWLANGSGEIFNPEPIRNEEFEETAKIFSDLSPELQKYALKQIKGLLEVQNKYEKEE